MGKVNFQTIWFQTEYCMILLGLRRFLFQNSIRKQKCLKKLLGISRNMKFASFSYYVPKLFVKDMCFLKDVLFFPTKNKGRTANTSCVLI